MGLSRKTHVIVFICTVVFVFSLGSRLHLTWLCASPETNPPSGVHLRARGLQPLALRYWHSAASDNMNVNTSMGFSVLGVVAGLSLVARRKRPGTCMATGRGTRSLTRSKSLCMECEPQDSIRRRFEALAAEAQRSICEKIAAHDGKATFLREEYTRDSGGGGVSFVLTNGDVFEKAGVNLSVVLR